MLKKPIKLILIVISLVGIGLLIEYHPSLAQEDLESKCSWSRIEEKPQNLSEEEYESLLRECQAYYQEKSESIEEDIEKTAQKKQTLQNRIYTLNRKIENLNYKIYQSNLVIKDLGVQIENTEDSIKETSAKIGKSTRELKEILRTMYEESQRPVAEILLSEEKLSGFFDNLVALQVLNSRNQELLKDIKDLKSYLEKQKEALAEEKKGLEKMVVVQQSEKNESKEIKEEKQRLKEMTEAEYQRYLEEKRETEETIENISTKLWKLLIGAREIPEYGQAVEIAKTVEGRTGVRAAFLLGILTQESRIGQNVGQCFVKDYDSGMGVVANNGQKWPRVMKPSRDIPIFLDTIEALNQNKNLGMNPKTTLVSCWIESCATYNAYGGYNYCGASVDSQGDIHCNYSGYLPYGWGGAMGPAQFIPSTWKNYKDKIAKMTGETADPWDFSHAALGSALLLKDCGALSSERSAAVCYLGADYLGYADNVLSLAECHQSYINNGSMSSRCQERIGLK